MAEPPLQAIKVYPPSSQSYASAGDITVHMQLNRAATRTERVLFDQVQVEMLPFMGFGRLYGNILEFAQTTLGTVQTHQKEISAALAHTSHLATSSDAPRPG